MKNVLIAVMLSCLLLAACTDSASSKTSSENATPDTNNALQIEEDSMDSISIGLGPDESAEVETSDAEVLTETEAAALNPKIPDGHWGGIKNDETAIHESPSKDSLAITFGFDMNPSYGLQGAIIERSDFYEDLYDQGPHYWYKIKFNQGDADPVIGWVYGAFVYDAM